MKRLRFFNKSLALLFIFSGALLMASCEDDENSDTRDTDNLEGQVWEPYQLKANTSYDYDFTISEESTEPSSGIISIDIGDPDVEVSGLVNDQEFYYTGNSGEDINENFIAALSPSPIGMTLYQPFWLNAFADQAIRVGNSWSYNYLGSSITFEVTETRTVAEIEGFVIETEFTDAESGISVNWYTCINQEIPLPLLVSVDYGEQGAYHMELTGYED